MKPKEQQGAGSAPRLLATFQVITDTHVRDEAGHIHNRHFEEALQDISSYCEGSLGIMHAGDVTDRGLAGEYAEFRRIWNGRPASLPELYVTLGNHDIGAVLWEEGGTPVDLSALPDFEVEDALDGHFPERADRVDEQAVSESDSIEADTIESASSEQQAEQPLNAAESLAEAAAEMGLDLAGMAERLGGSDATSGQARELWKRRMRRFAEGTGEAAPYHDHWIGGYHFIFLGSESPHPKDCDLSEAQLTWLQDRLAEEAKPNQPIFIFLHQPVRDTVAGSMSEQGWYGVNQDEALKEVLSGYPQAILFTGHTHWQLEAKRMMYDGQGTMPSMFNASSVAYLWTDQDEHLTGSEGLQVEIYENRVVVRGRDFVTRSWIAGAEYTVNIPASVLQA